VLAITALVLTDVLDITWSNKILLEDRQPAGINYESYDPYCLYIIRQHHLLRTSDIIMIQRAGDSVPSYGHRLEYPFTFGLDEIKNLELTWTPDGVTLEHPMGHKLFIPERAFTGGR
jgi:hypothetical protein